MGLTSQMDEDLKLDFKPLALSPQPLTFGNTLNHRRSNSIIGSDLDISGVIRPKNNSEPKPPNRRNSKLSTEKLVKRGHYGLVSQFEGLKQLSSYGLTYASQLLSIVVRSSTSKTVVRTGLLHADLSTGSQTVQEFVLATTGETIRDLIYHVNTRSRQGEKTKDDSSIRNKSSSAPSLAVMLSPMTPSSVTEIEHQSSNLDVVDSNSGIQEPKGQELSKPGAGTASGNLYKHRSSTDSTDSGVGSQLGHSDNDQIQSPTSSTSSRSPTTSSRTSPDSHYQNREFIQLIKFESDKKRSLTNNQQISTAQIVQKTPANTSIEVNNNSQTQLTNGNNFSSDLVTSELDFEFTLFHVGFDVLPCFMVLRGLNVDIHHFTMKTGKSAYLRVCTQTGASNTGLLPSLTSIPKSTYV